MIEYVLAAVVAATAVIFGVLLSQAKRQRDRAEAKWAEASSLNRSLRQALTQAQLDKHKAQKDLDAVRFRNKANVSKKKSNSHKSSNKNARRRSSGAYGTPGNCAAASTLGSDSCSHSSDPSSFSGGSSCSSGSDSGM